jgi:prepilin-type N-terminal cleavage/methylation domain-containing protein
MNVWRSTESGARRESRPERAGLFRWLPRSAARRGFTLIEMIVVMALLVAVIAVGAPSLAGFFRGRAVDAEARRFMTLTRVGQSRAAAEALPMILWVDLQQRTYGLEVDSSFVTEDPKAVQYTLDSSVTLEIGGTETLESGITADTLFGSGLSASRNATLPHIRFEPDGGVSPSSPESFRLSDLDGGSLWVGQSANRLSYEIYQQEYQRTLRVR